MLNKFLLLQLKTCLMNMPVGQIVMNLTKFSTYFQPKLARLEVEGWWRFLIIVSIRHGWDVIKK